MLIQVQKTSERDTENAFGPPTKFTSILRQPVQIDSMTTISLKHLQIEVMDNSVSLDNDVDIGLILNWDSADAPPLTLNDAKANLALSDELYTATIQAGVYSPNSFARTIEDALNRRLNQIATLPEPNFTWQVKYLDDVDNPDNCKYQISMLSKGTETYSLTNNESPEHVAFSGYDILESVVRNQVQPEAMLLPGAPNTRLEYTLVRDTSKNITDVYAVPRDQFVAKELAEDVSNEPDASLTTFGGITTCTDAYTTPRPGVDGVPSVIDDVYMAGFWVHGDGAWGIDHADLANENTFTVTAVGVSNAQLEQLKSQYGANYALALNRSSADSYEWVDQLKLNIAATAKRSDGTLSTEKLDRRITSITDSNNTEHVLFSDQIDQVLDSTDSTCKIALQNKSDDATRYRYTAAFFLGTDNYHTVSGTRFAENILFFFSRTFEPVYSDAVATDEMKNTRVYLMAISTKQYRKTTTKSSLFQPISIPSLTPGFGEVVPTAGAPDDTFHGVTPNDAGGMIPVEVAVQFHKAGDMSTMVPVGHVEDDTHFDVLIHSQTWSNILTRYSDVYTYNDHSRPLMLPMLSRYGGVDQYQYPETASAIEGDPGQKTVRFSFKKVAGEDTVEIWQPLVIAASYDNTARTTPLVDNPYYTGVLYDVVAETSPPQSGTSNERGPGEFPVLFKGDLGHGITLPAHLEPPHADSSTDLVRHTAGMHALRAGASGYQGQVIYLDDVATVLGINATQINNEHAQWLLFGTATQSVESNININTLLDGNSSIAFRVENIPINSFLANGQRARVLEFFDLNATTGFVSYSRNQRNIDGETVSIRELNFTSSKPHIARVNTSLPITLSSIDISISDARGRLLDGGTSPGDYTRSPIVALQATIEIQSNKHDSDNPTKRAKLG